MIVHTAIGRLESHDPQQASTSAPMAVRIRASYADWNVRDIELGFGFAVLLACCVHLLIQMGLLLLIVVSFGLRINAYWLWLPLVLGLEVVFVTGLSLLTAGLNVFIRDTRYVVESVNTVLFWLVPIFYSLAVVPRQYWEIYQFNPLAALTVCLRNVWKARRPPFRCS